jgi:hypothetical protein
MDLMDILTQQLSGSGLKQISQQAGTDEQGTSQVVSAAIPLLISALARNASQPDGANALHNALQQHDGGILDNLSGYLTSGTGSSAGAGILGHVLGDRQNTVQSALSKQTGLDAGSIATILATLAPIVLGAIGRQQRQGGFDPGALSGYLNGQQQQAQAAAPDMMGSLTSLLDSNNDGSVIDDLGRMASKFFGNR